MVSLAHEFQRIAPFKALVIGDFLLDAYTKGKVKRISPEAPVPIMEVQSQEERPGGAGNVVLNLLALGGTVTAVGRIGDDAGGLRLKALLQKANTSALLIEPDYQTPVKNRLIADGQQLLRIDHEKISPLTAVLEKRFVTVLEKLIGTVDVVAISDYGKGFLTHSLTQTILQICKRKKVPSVVDPKGIDFSKYRGSTVLKPNLSEAMAAAHCTDLQQAAIELLPIAETLLITRSEAGISIFEQSGERFDYPVRSREVKDVTGAGDTVLSTICMALANGLDLKMAAQLANIAAGIAVERIGCAQVSLSDLASRLLESTKIFDEEHTFTLQQALRTKKPALLTLTKGQAITPELFKTIRALAQKQEDLIVYVEGAKEDDELVQVLASLQEVRLVLLREKAKILIESLLN